MPLKSAIIGVTTCIYSLSILRDVNDVVVPLIFGSLGLQILLWVMMGIDIR